MRTFKQLFTQHALRMALRLVICILAATLTLIQSLYWIAVTLTMIFVTMTGIPLLVRNIGSWLRWAFWDNGLRPLAWSLGHKVTPPSWLMSSLVIPPPMCSESLLANLLRVEPIDLADVTDVSADQFIEQWDASSLRDVGIYADEEDEDEALPPPQSTIRDSAIATLDLPDWVLPDAALPDATIELPAASWAIYRGIETEEENGVPEPEPIDFDSWCRMWSPSQRGEYRDV